MPGLPPIIYHYTESQASVGIATSGVIWARLNSELNDAREFIDGPEIARALLKGHFETLDGYKYRWSHDARVEAAIALGWTTPPPAWITSFSAEGNDLTQWRAYAPTGWALGFDAYAIERQAALLPGWSLVQCVYGAERRQLIDSVITGVLDDPAAHHWTEEFLTEQIVSAVREVAGRVKDPNFGTEQEWRLVYSGSDLASSSYAHFPLPANCLRVLRRAPGEPMHRLPSIEDPVPAAFAAGPLGPTELDVSHIPWRGPR
ncbi:hypothetical protein acdb102_44360 [Acidothermaceae bacterium B102]|nr:hypothetical protein acdb102_44360 [Acidothermaceae bacterium B102]